MRFVLRLLLIALITWLAHMFLPQWTVWPIVLGAFLVGWVLSHKHKRSIFVRKKPPKAFAFWAGFIAVAAIWGILLWQIDTANESIMSTRMAALLSQGNESLTGLHLLLLTSVLGGLIGGFSAMTGNLFGEAIKSE